MLDKRINLDEKTSVPLFAALGILPFLIGGIIWLATIDGKASGAQEDLRGVKQLLLDVRERVIHIEDKLSQTKTKE